MDVDRKFIHCKELAGKILGWYLWLPDGITIADLHVKQEVPDTFAETKPSLRFLPAKFRRRVSDVSALSLHVAHMTLQCLKEKQEITASVFASRHGEGHVTISLFEEILHDEVLSPLAFSRSVHNTASGLFSIAHENRAPQTSVSAGEDTAAMALVEATAQAQSSGQPVLLVLADEWLHPVYIPCVEEPSIPYGLGMIIAPGSESMFTSDIKRTRLADGLDLAYWLSSQCVHLQLHGEDG